MTVLNIKIILTNPRYNVMSVSKCFILISENDNKSIIDFSRCKILGFSKLESRNLQKLFSQEIKISDPELETLWKQIENGEMGKKIPIATIRKLYETSSWIIHEYCAIFSKLKINDSKQKH